MRPVFTLLLCLVTLYGTAQKTLHYTIYFDFDKDSLNSGTAQQLFEISGTLQGLAVTEIKITGHTDMRGTNAYNRSLSSRRAVTIEQKLKEALPAITGIDVAYYGKDSLITLNDKEQDKNRRVEITILYKEQNETAKAEIKTEEPVTMLEPFYNDVEEQQFTINLDDTVVVRGKNGTRLKIAPGSIQNKKSEIVKGYATLVMKEYYEPGDIVMAGLNSASAGGLLQTGGMAWFAVIKDNDTMAQTTKKPVEIRMPWRNKELTGMGVFTIHNAHDSAGWNYFGKNFTKTLSYWDWPESGGKLEGIGQSEFYRDGEWISSRYENWIANGKDEEYYRVVHPLFTLWPGMDFGNTANTRRVKQTVKKIDSVTISVQEHITYRNRGYKVFATRYFDTSFFVKYTQPEYKSLISNLDWINCDRFLNIARKTDFYVSTPNFNGARILVYFKKLHAYMPASLYNTAYRVARVPPGEDVSIVAFGKQGDNFYFGRSDYSITEKGKVAVELTKLSSDDFKKAMRSL